VCRERPPVEEVAEGAAGEAVAEAKAE